jgi:type IV pilus assembly protein PilE
MIRRNECKRRKNRLGGMTLIELLIVVSVVAILAAIAYPNYQSYVLKSYRTQALADLSRIQLQLESSYNSGYSWSSLVSGGVCSICESPTDRFSFSVVSQANKAYIIKATAQSGTGQTTDQCLTDQNANYISLDSTNTVYPEDCWI